MNPTPNLDYQMTFEFARKIRKLTITRARPQLTPADVKRLEAGERSAQDAD